MHSFGHKKILKLFIYMERVDKWSVKIWLSEGHGTEVQMRDDLWWISGGV